MSTDDQLLSDRRCADHDFSVSFISPRNKAKNTFFVHSSYKRNELSYMRTITCIVFRMIHSTIFTIMFGNIWLRTMLSLFFHNIFSQLFGIGVNEKNIFQNRAITNKNLNENQNCQLGASNADKILKLNHTKWNIKASQCNNSSQMQHDFRSVDRQRQWRRRRRQWMRYKKTVTLNLFRYLYDNVECLIFTYRIWCTGIYMYELITEEWRCSSKLLSVAWVSMICVWVWVNAWMEWQMHTADSLHVFDCIENDWRWFPSR